MKFPRKTSLASLLTVASIKRQKWTQMWGFCHQLIRKVEYQLSRKNLIRHSVYDKQASDGRESDSRTHLDSISISFIRKLLYHYGSKLFSKWIYVTSILSQNCNHLLFIFVNKSASNFKFNCTCSSIDQLSSKVSTPV